MFKSFPPDTPRAGSAPPLIGSAAGTAGFLLVGCRGAPPLAAGGFTLGAAAGSGRARARCVPSMALLLLQLLRRLLRCLGWPRHQVRPAAAASASRAARASVSPAATWLGGKGGREGGHRGRWGGFSAARTWGGVGSLP